MKYKEKFNFNKLREESIKMLIDITDSLDSHKIKYWLDFGTLLGAVRDGKVIPWDGDFDLSSLENNLESNTDLWEEISNKGYNVKIEYNNIKFIRKNWHVGYFKIDLHRYRINSFGDAEYLYGNKLGRFTSFFKLILNQLEISLIQTDKEKINFTEYDYLFKFLLKNNYKVDEIFEIEEIQYEKDFPNDQRDFSLVIKEKNLISKSIDQSGLKIWLLRKFISLLNPFLVKSIIRFLKKNKIKGGPPLLKVTHNMSYFKNFDTIEFCSKEFNIPKNKFKYLESIYGLDWKTPVNNWEITNDSPKRN